MIKSLVQGFVSLVSRPSEQWDFQERRRLVRMRCRYRCIAEVGGERQPATISDLGVGGLRLRLGSAPPAGQWITIFTPFGDESLDGEPVRAEVLWSRQNRDGAAVVGLRYAADPESMDRSWVRTVIKHLGFRPESLLSKRKWVRADCVLEGSLNRGDGQPPRVQIHNLGVGGALFEHSGVLPLCKASLRIGPYEGLAAFEVHGHLIKARPDGKAYLYGLEFDQLDPEQLRHLSLYLKKLLKHSWEI